MTTRNTTGATEVQCPRCGDEYEPGIATCRTCQIPLAPPGARPPLQTRHLGRFAAPVADRVLLTLRSKGIDYDLTRDDEVLEIRVDAPWRDDVAASLYASWPELLSALEAEQRAALPAGGTHPGWLDAPLEVWADRDGRLMMDITADGDPDQVRAVGPAMVVLGLSVLLLGLVDAIGLGVAATIGITLAVVGALLPR